VALQMLESMVHETLLAALSVCQETFDWRRDYMIFEVLFSILAARLYRSSFAFLLLLLSFFSSS